MNVYRAMALFVALALAGSVGGCAGRRPYVWVDQLPAAERTVANDPLGPGDQIVVQEPHLAELPAEPITVNADGTIVLPLVGLIKVQGLTPAEAAQQLNARLKGIVVEPAAVVSIVNPRPPRVMVVGEVRTPGHNPALSPGDGVLEAIALAGGLTEFADPNDIYVVRTQPKPARIRFRYRDLTGGHTESLGFQLRDGDVIVVE